MAGKILISRRPGDIEPVALRLRDVLARRFGPDALLMESDAPRAAERQPDAAPRDFDAVVVLLGDGWVDAPLGPAKDDPFHQMIETAQRRGVALLLAPLDDASIPSPERLPQVFQALVKRQAVRLRRATFDANAHGLATEIAGALDRARVERAATTATAARRADAVQSETFAVRRATLAAETAPGDLRQAEERAHWEAAQARGTPSALRDHLARYPGGETEAAARTLLTNLAWSSLAETNDWADIDAFLEEFPDDRMGAALEARLLNLLADQAEALQVARRAALARVAWRRLRGAKDPNALLEFARQYPESSQAAEARRAADALLAGGTLLGRVYQEFIGVLPGLLAVFAYFLAAIFGLIVVAELLLV